MQDLLIYYGYLNSFNSAENSWNNTNVINDISKYNVLVAGDGIQNSGHPDYSNSQVIISGVQASGVQVYGYVTANQTLENFQTKVEKWETLGVDGIFIDEAGYDFGVTRDEFNQRVAYVHSQVKANKCFVNAWNPHHVISRVNDPSYPNTTYNANDNNSLLASDDWFLLESLGVNTDSYTPNGIGVIADLEARVDKLEAALTNSEKTINVAACGIINDTDTKGQAKFNILYSLADLFDVDMVGSSDTLYGASTAKAKYWTRPMV